MIRDRMTAVDAPIILSGTTDTGRRERLWMSPACIITQQAFDFTALEEPPA